MLFYRSIGCAVVWATCVLSACSLHASEAGLDDHPAHDGVHKHHVALFVGATSSSGGTHGTTVGADYSFRVHRLASLALAIDYAAGDVDATILAAGVFLHPTHSIRILVAPGFDYHDGHEEAVLRVGVLYDFDVGNWTLSPTVHVDALEVKENVIYGLSFGYGF